MSRSILAAAALAALLAGCEAGSAGEPADAGLESSMPSPTPSGSPADAVKTTCGAEKLDRWLDALPTDAVKAQVAATVGERPIRYYRQGDPITMDFSEARLNVELGADGRIKLFRCG